MTRDELVEKVKAGCDTCRVVGHPCARHEGWVDGYIEAMREIRDGSISTVAALDELTS